MGARRRGRGRAGVMVLGKARRDSPNTSAIKRIVRNLMLGLSACGQAALSVGIMNCE